MRSGDLTTRLTFLRPAAATDDGLQLVPGAPAEMAQRPWAMRRDVSDGEVVRAGMVLGFKVSRFQLRRSAFTAGIRVTDLLQADGMTYDISGIKLLDGIDLEITAVARVDRT